MTMEILFRYASLFCFTAASFGFVYFHLRYGRGSSTRLWGIRICYAFGFAGVLMHWMWVGQMNQVALFMLLLLTVSLLGFEVAERYLRGS
jgi:hypothetical protein